MEEIPERAPAPRSLWANGLLEEQKSHEISHPDAVKSCRRECLVSNWVQCTSDTKKIPSEMEVALLNKEHLGNSRIIQEDLGRSKNSSSSSSRGNN